MIYSAILTIISLVAVGLITFYGHSDLDVSKIKVENIDILEVFYHNFIMMFSSTILGIFTAGTYSLCILIINIANVGILSNALYINNMGHLIYKLIPHGIIEFMSLCLCVIYSFFLFIYLIKSIKQVFLKKYDIKLLIKKIFISLTVFIVVNTVLLSIAAVIEYII